LLSAFLVFLQILALRQESAALLGFPNFAELSMDSKVGPSIPCDLGLQFCICNRRKLASRKRRYWAPQFFAQLSMDGKVDPSRPLEISKFAFVLPPSNLHSD